MLELRKLCLNVRRLWDGSNNVASTMAKSGSMAPSIGAAEVTITTMTFIIFVLTLISS
jgi:hypothetical protein